jgi:predicted RNase H-like HicB family nuclease
LKYAILLEPQPEGGYTVTVPDLPGCVSEGETEEECRANIAEAILGWIETAQANDWSVPTPSRRFDFVEVKAS